MTPTSALEDLERRHVTAPHDLDLITDCTQCTLERAHVSPYVPHKMRATAAAASPLLRGLCDSSSSGGTGGGGGRVDCDDVTSSDTEVKDYTAFLQQQNSKNASKQQSQQPQQQQQQQRYKVNFSSNLTDFYERPKFN